MAARLHLRVSMADPLSTYLEDHAAGAAAAVELLEAMRRQHEGEELGRFAGEILGEVQKDRATLKSLLERLDPGAQGLKEAVSWLGEKVSRLKLGRLAGGELGTLEALETLSLGILGKQALWRALLEVAEGDSRLRDMDFAALAARAQGQHARVEKRRLEAARQTLRTGATSSVQP